MRVISVCSYLLLRYYCARSPGWFTPLRKPAGIAKNSTHKGSTARSPSHGASDKSQFIAGIGAIRWSHSALGACIHRDRLCDPACGSGSLLLKFAKLLGVENMKEFLGQKSNPTTYNLCRINMLLHNVPFDKFDIAHGDTLIDPQHQHLELFEAIVSNPPYSTK